MCHRSIGRKFSEKIARKKESPDDGERVGADVHPNWPFRGRTSNYTPRVRPQYEGAMTKPSDAAPCQKTHTPQSRADKLACRCKEGDEAMTFGLALILINLVLGFVAGYSFRAATEKRSKTLPRAAL